MGLSVVVFYAPHKILGGHKDLHFSVHPSVRPIVRMYVRTTLNLVYATPPTPLDGFCSYPHTVTNMTWRLDFAMLQVLHELWDFVIGGHPCPTDTLLVCPFFQTQCWYVKVDFSRLNVSSTSYNRKC